MRRVGLRLLWVTLLPGLMIMIHAQTSAGNSFWLARLDHCDDTYMVLLSNPSSVITANILIEYPYYKTKSISLQLPPGNRTTRSLPCEGDDSSIDNNNNTTASPVFHILADQPIHAYAFLVSEQKSMGSFLLPTTALGINYQVVMSDESTTLAVIAIQDETRVRINKQLVTTLNTGEAYITMQSTPVSLSSKYPMAVFLGSTTSHYSQVVPQAVLGNKYFLCPIGTTTASTFRYVAIQDNTTLKLKAPFVRRVEVLLMRGQVHERQTSQPHRAVADQPIYVYQSVNQNEFVVVPPVGQFLFDYSLPTWDDDTDDHQMQIIQPVGSMIRADRTMMDGNQNCVSTGGIRVYDVEYCCRRVPMVHGTTHVSSSQRFAAIVYSNQSVTGFVGMGFQPIALGCNTGGPYRIEAFRVPATISLKGESSLQCDDAQQLNASLTWRSNDYEMLIRNDTDPYSLVDVTKFGSYEICMTASCQDSNQEVECCSSIDVLRAKCDAGGPYNLQIGDGFVFLSGKARCDKGVDPQTSWSSNAAGVSFTRSGSLETKVLFAGDRSFEVCLDVACGADSTKCCAEVFVPEQVPTFKPFAPPTTAPSRAPFISEAVPLSPAGVAESLPVATVMSTANRKRQPTQAPTPEPSPSPMQMMGRNGRPSSIQTTAPGSLDTDPPTPVPMMNVPQTRRQKPTTRPSLSASSAPMRRMRGIQPPTGSPSPGPTSNPVQPVRMPRTRPAPTEEPSSSPVRTRPPSPQPSPEPTTKPLRKVPSRPPSPFNTGQPNTSRDSRFSDVPAVPEDSTAPVRPERRMMMMRMHSRPPHRKGQNMHMRRPPRWMTPYAKKGSIGLKNKNDKYKLPPLLMTLDPKRRWSYWRLPVGGLFSRDSDEDN